jgi:hypothetical protein
MSYCVGEAGKSVVLEVPDSEKASSSATKGADEKIEKGNTIDLVLIDPQSVGKRTHNLMDTANEQKRWKTICWHVNKYLK